MNKKAFVLLITLALMFATSANALAKEITIRGKLQKTVEAGGWLIVTENQKYLILNAKEFQNEKWFAAATEVEVTGKEKPGVVTTYMEGTPFKVRTMHAVKHEESAVGANGAQLTSVMGAPTRIALVSTLHLSGFLLCLGHA
jgi:hypothetical protein